MTTLHTLDLNADWTCDYFELRHSMYEFLRGWPVAALTDWTFDRRRIEGWAAWLQRAFTLESTDECVRYLLYIDSAPPAARIYLNGQHVADYTPPHEDAPPFEIDVTPYVYLDENTIAFRVDYHDPPGAFSGVCLQPVPCEPSD